MRICLLSKMFPPSVGGSEMYAYEIANALARRGHSVDVYTQAAEKEMTLPLENGVTVERVCKARRYLVTFETLNYSAHARWSIDFGGYDVVHGTLMPASTITLLRGVEDTPVVLTSHGTSVDETLSHEPEVPTDYLKRYFFHPMNVVMDALAGRGADRIIGISSGTCERLTSTYGFDESKVTHVPHGVDTGRFYPTPERHSAVSEDCLTLLFVGRLVSRKGLDLAIDALAALDRENVEFLIAGTGSHEDRLRSQAAEHGVADLVEFLGYVPDDDLPTLYSSADVFVSPSVYEGFGLTFLEAMACGTPIIGTAVGGIPDVVENGQTGYVVEREPRVVADRIDRLADDSTLLEFMSQNVLETVQSMTWDHVASQVEEVYRAARD